MNSIRLAVSSVLTALSYPRVWISALALVLVASLLHVFPVYRAMDGVLAHYPVDALTVDPMLEPDLAREVSARVSLTAGHLFMLIAWIFLGGGILAAVGTRESFEFSNFLSEAARLFMRNLRVVVLGVPVLLILFWGLGALDTWIREDLLYDSDPGSMSLFGWQPRVATWEFLLWGLQIFWGLAFLMVVFTSKLAMARLAMDNRRSALAAWSAACFLVLRHPIQSVMTVVLLCLILIGVTFGLGELTVEFLENQGNLWLGLLSSQAGMAFAQVVLMAFFLAARKLVAAQRSPSGLVAEPVVELPRRRVVTRNKVSARA